MQTRVSEPEPGYLAGAGAVTLAGSGATLKICLIIHEHYMELNII